MVKSLALRSLVGFARDGRGAGGRFQDMGMVGCFDDLTRDLVLLTDLNVPDPVIGQDFIQSGALAHGHFEHSANDIPAFTGKDT